MAGSLMLVLMVRGYSVDRDGRIGKPSCRASAATTPQGRVLSRKLTEPQDQGLCVESAAQKIRPGAAVLQAHSASEVAALSILASPS